MGLIRDWTTIIVVLAIITVVLWAALMAVLGLSTVRGQSDYTGYVVDMEYEKGIVFKTTQVKMKTHPRSSEHETFCVKVPDNGHQVDALREALAEQRRIRVEYSRPLYVPVWECDTGLSIVRDIEAVNETQAE